MISRFVIALLFIVSNAPAFSQAAPAKSTTVTAAMPTPDDRARRWLVLIDDKNYAQGWSESAKSFQAKQANDAWTRDEAAKREPLGAVASRDIKSIDLGRTNIAVIRYDTVFAHKAAAVETVTLAFENGSWSVTAYTID
jgi:hypothetical protein